MSNMASIHIWIGTTKKNQEEYDCYFDLDYSTEGDFDDPEYRVCQFCIDINQKWYDEDMLGNIPLFCDNQPVENLISLVPIYKEEVENILSICSSLGVKSGNAIFYYTDSELVIDEPCRDNYNGLSYIGRFKSSLH